MGGAKQYPSIASYGDDGFRRLNPSYATPLMQFHLRCSKRQRNFATLGRNYLKLVHGVQVVGFGFLPISATGFVEVLNRTVQRDAQPHDQAQT
jgi:hypothetical protein